MTLREVLAKENDFSRFGKGNWDSISIRDKEGETLKIVSLSDANKLEPKFLDSSFLTIGSSTMAPTRLIIRIDYLER